MYVKIFTSILDSSLARDHKLRHFFMDLLLLADQEGEVIKTPLSIAIRIGLSEEEVIENLERLCQPDPNSKTPDNEGRRVERMEGIGYGWRIVNYKVYRQMKDADQMREATRARVQRFREKKRQEEQGNTPVTQCNAGNADVTPGNAIAEAEAKAEATSPLQGDSAGADSAPKKKKTAAKKPQISNEEFLQQLRENPAYHGIDIDREIGKMKAWLLTPPGTGRQLTRGFIVKWLNRIDAPIEARVPAGYDKFAKGF